MTATLHLGDCREVMALMGEASVDAIVTDPPYGLEFMGKEWDHGVPGVPFWEAALRVLKPGGHLLAFGGTRTSHRLTCAVEDAGFEIRDCLMWLYGSGFPKSLDVSKHLDQQERSRWLAAADAIAQIDIDGIIAAWKRSDSAGRAIATFQRSQTGVGPSTPKSDSVLVTARLQVSHRRPFAPAIIAELLSSAVRRTASAAAFSAPENAASDTTELSVLATIAGRSPESHGATPSTEGSFAPCDAWACLAESTGATARAGEALKTWLGRRKSFDAADTDALCAALTDALKHIILGHSKTFLSLDTKSRTDFASATSATITESTAASLISFTADTLRREAIDKAAGAEREVVGTKQAGLGSGSSYAFAENGKAPKEVDITAPATEAARIWDGWGTALKPAWEPIILARKPLIGTVAANVLAHGTGALNVDGCRVGDKKRQNPSCMNAGGTAAPVLTQGRETQGRWPANVILDESAAAMLDEQSEDRVHGAGHARGGSATPRETAESTWQGPSTTNTGSMHRFGDSGGASRFFYTAKTSSSERHGNDGANGQAIKNDHPTVKPVDLMAYLVKLVTPPDGTVLDPFMGSGSTGIAALRLGFEFVGIEREEGYIKIAEVRIREDAPLFNSVESDLDTNR